MRFFLPLYLFISSYLVGEAKDTYPIYPFSQKIIVDGKAEEAVWSKIPYSEKLIALKGNGKVNYETRFKLFSDKTKLFVLVELKGQKLDDLLKMKTNADKGEKLSGDYLTFLFSPMPQVDDHYRVFVDFHGNVKDCFYPAKAGHGFPYSAKVDYEWSSETKCAFGQENGDSIFLEMELSVNKLNLQKNLFSGFGFNLIRNATYLQPAANKKGKARPQTEVSSWADINAEIWNTQKFGLIKGPLYKEPENFSKADLENLDQMTNGMTALMKSLDLYFKAINKYKYHIPEGTEVNGDIGNFDHCPIPQYTVKADGYFRFYHALKYEPYKNLGNHIINKLYQGFIETKDANGKNYLVWNNLMSDDGKVYAYDQGKKMSLFAPGRVPYNQSRNKFHLKDVVFQDALGQGFIDLSEIKDALDPGTRSKIQEMLVGTLEFLHQPYILVDNGREYYWRIDSFAPYKPKSFEGELEKGDWQYLGQDIILMYVALAQFEPNLAKPFEESIKKFSQFYQSGRLSVHKDKGPHAPHNIYKLDRRMLTLAGYGLQNNIEWLAQLHKWLLENLPEQYSEMPKVEYSVNGVTKNSWSTQGVLEVYRLLGMNKEYKKFWDLSFTENMKPTGLFQGHQILPMNFSSYPIYFDYAKRAYDFEMLDAENLKSVYRKMFSFYGNPKIHRNNLMYGRDLTEEQRTRPMWGNTPYDCYVEGVLPEGIYANASAQAFYSIFGNYSINEFFKTREEHARYEYNFRYYQYTAPFQFHSDRYSYGKAESACLANMQKSRLEKSELDASKSILVKCKTPDLPSGLPVFGALDITDILFEEESATKPTNLKLVRVSLGEKEIPFRSYQILEFDRILSDKDKAKVVFGLWSEQANQELEIKLYFQEKKFKNYFANGGAINGNP